jgi:hypothetical protein
MEHMATMKRNNSEITDVVDDTAKRAKNNEDNLKDDTRNDAILFIINYSNVKKVVLEDIDPLPWKDNLIKNHDIFALNNVHNATTVDRHMMSVNRIGAMAPILVPLFGVLFLGGCNSLKKRSYCPLLRRSGSPFKDTCFFIYLIVLPFEFNGS